VGQRGEAVVAGRRAELGMTQAEAAAKAGVSLATWRRFEQSPGLGYRGDTIRGVLRALRVSHDELAGLLEGGGPVQAGVSREGWEANWNQSWAASWPSVTARMAGAIQAALDMARDMLSSGLGDSVFDPEDCPVLGQLDPRVFIAVGENRAWFRAVARRLGHLVDAMDGGQLIDESCECFADAALFAAAVREAAGTWDDDDDAGVWAGLSDELPAGEKGDPAAGEGQHAGDWRVSRWDDLDEDLDDRMPYREWDCVFAEYRKARLLLDHRPVETWFDEPDAELDAFRVLAPSNVLAQELMRPRGEV
jgi:transcriptional regulator with XRE-family HTH domain